MPIDSILTSIKKLLGIEADYTFFDEDIRIAINTSLFVLNQLGLGPEEGFSIQGNTEIWTDFLGEYKDIEAVKTQIYLRTRLIFDPPSNSFLVTAIQKQIEEYEWRLNVEMEVKNGITNG